MKALKKFEFKETRQASKYPWDKLLDGGIYQMTQAEDFPDVGNIDHMPPKIKHAARRRYKTVKVQIDRENMTVVVQAFDMTTEQRAAEDAKRAEEKAKRKSVDSDADDTATDE
jgi:hypothetical protein